MAFFKERLGRNDLCLCGSGKKYKKCCIHTNDLEDNAQEETNYDDVLLRKLKHRYPHRYYRIVQSEEVGEFKVSEVILEYAEDFIAMAQTEQDQKEILALCMMAWNLSFLDKTKRTQELNCFMDDLNIKKDDPGRMEIKTLFEVLMDKRKEEYPFVKRQIMDFQIKKTRDDIILNVISSPMPA